MKNNDKKAPEAEVVQLSEVEVKSNVQLSADLGQPQQKVKINTKKIKYNSLTTVSTALVLAVIILINVAVGLASERFNLRLDLTEEQVFTLDEATIEYLQELDTPVELIVVGEEQAFSSASSLSNAISPERYVYETLNNYARENENISIHYIDPRYNPYFYKSRGISLDDGTDTAENIFLVVYCPETQRYRYVKDTIFEGLTYVGLERRLTSGILYTTKEDLQTIAFIKGHGEEDNPYFQQTLIDNGYEVKLINLMEFDSIVDYDIDLLVISNPTRNYSIDDINKIDQWLSNNDELGKHLMVFADLNTSSNKYLEEYLLEWGMYLGTENIFDTQNSYTFENAIYPLLKVQYHENAATIAEELATGKFNQFVQLGAARAVYTKYETKDSITTYPMIVTSDSAFSRYTASTNISTSDWKNFKKQEGDTVGPFNLSVLAQKARYDETSTYTSSVYLCGSTSFIDDYFISNIDGNNAQTAEYMVKLVKYMISSTEDIDITVLPTQLIFSTLNITETWQLSVIFFGLVFGIPLVFAVIGIIVHRRRKFL
ncbi:MAG: GldG family protein [Clostridia bacterium]|nr:GldG family protein [Clostridia bacterium]